MATRFYLPSTGAPAISPAFDASWDSTTNAIRREMVTTRISSAMTNVAGAAELGTNTDHLLVQYVSDTALAAQTISGTIKGQARYFANNAGTGITAIRVAKCSSDGSGVTEILAITFSADAGAPLIPLTTATNRRYEQGTDDFLLDLTNTGVSSGDFLIVEVGYRKVTATTARLATIVVGDDSGTDLAEDEATTTANNPWVEFSMDISFAGGGGGSVIPIFMNQHRQRRK